MVTEVAVGEDGDDVGAGRRAFQTALFVAVNLSGWEFNTH